MNLRAGGQPSRTSSPLGGVRGNAPAHVHQHAPAFYYHHDFPRSISSSLGASQGASLEHATRILQKIYGYPKLREHQREVLNEFLAGHDTLAVIPTGGGKSMCYVLPAMMGPGVGVVISPLIALIRDQVIAQRKAKIAAAAFDSLQSPEEKNQVVQALRHGLVKLLYISPERLAQSRFQEFLSGLPLRFIAVDEAHCASEWGTDFRPEYRKISTYLDQLPSSIPRLALTATATQKVRGDIIRFLGLRTPRLIIKSPLRNNLDIECHLLDRKSSRPQYSKSKKKQKKKSYRSAAIRTPLQVQAQKHSSQIAQHLPDNLTSKGIIYTFSRKNCERMSRELNALGCNTLPYHGGMSGPQRQQTQERFQTSQVSCVVATNAFGMGIDLSGIRYVHHYGLPTSLESYIQQIGRAGRDGQPAQCRLFYSKSDYTYHKKLIISAHPQPSTLGACFTEFLQQAQKGVTGLDAQALFSLLGERHRMDDLLRSLEILIKENFLQGPLPGYQVKNIPPQYRWSLTHQPPCLDGFLQQYPLRKRETMRRLDIMSSYVLSSPDQRIKLVQQYFAKAP